MMIDFCVCWHAIVCVDACYLMLSQAVNKQMQLEVNRLKWEHMQEIAEIRHNAG